MSLFTLVIDPSSSDLPSRLDVFVSKNENISRSRLKKGVKNILVDGKKAKLSYKLIGSENISIEWDDPVPENIFPENIPLDIVYEDNNVTVINKAQGMVTHPAAGNWTGTLVNALLYHWGCSTVFEAKEITGSKDVKRPGIVHRLDKDTSGLIITAKNRIAEDFLQQQFQKRYVKKEYIAIVNGKLPAWKGSIKTNIVRDPRNRKRFISTLNKDEGKFAWTEYKCVGIYGPYSLVKLRIKTGRTHQIRVHLKSLGCPILGDPIYGKKDPLFKKATLMLHSRRLKIRLSENSEMSVFKAPVPVRFKKVIHELKKSWTKVIENCGNIQ